MKHTQHIVPIKTNRNKFNNSIPFRVIFSGTFNRNIYYDLSSAYLKIKIRYFSNPRVSFFAFIAIYNA